MHTTFEPQDFDRFSQTALTWVDNYIQDMQGHLGFNFVGKEIKLYGTVMAKRSLFAKLFSESEIQSPTNQ